MFISCRHILCVCVMYVFMSSVDSVFNNASCYVQGWTPGCIGIPVHRVYTCAVDIAAVLCSDTWWCYQV